MIQIQHLLKLNINCLYAGTSVNLIQIQHLLKLNINCLYAGTSVNLIQIQHLLKLNARKINLYDFIVLLKVLINKDFSYFLPAITRFEGI